MKIHRILFIIIPILLATLPATAKEGPAPASPRLSVIHTGWRSAGLEWTAPKQDGKKFRLLRKDPSGTWTSVSEFPARKGVFTDHDLDTGGTYAYRLVLMAAGKTGVMRGGDKARIISLPLAGATELILSAGDAGDGIGSDHAVWGSPVLIKADGKRVSLTSLEPASFSVGYGEPGPIKSLVIGGSEYPDSIFAHSISRIVYVLDGEYDRFEASVGVGNPGAGTVTFTVEASPAPGPASPAAGVESETVTVKTRKAFHSPGGTTYYVDARKGNDLNAGTSPKRAWKSLDRVNGSVFAAGDRILFKAGSRYSGTLAVRGSGNESAPITVGKYGGRKKPRIDGEGKVPEVLLVRNVEFWEIADIEITNHGKTRASNRRGVFIHASNFGTMRHIHISNLHIHDVNGTIPKSGGGSAISWHASGAEIRSRFDGLVIDGCHIDRCERNAITGGGHWSRSEWFPSLNVVIRNNLIERVPGDGIVPIACDGALVERNVMRACTDFPGIGAAAGMWPWSADNTVFQFNEVYGHKNWADGQPFDSDDNCRNTIFQYNYSRDNTGGFMLIIGTNSDGGLIGTTVRYNISVNDGTRVYEKRYSKGGPPSYAPLFHIVGGVVRDTKIYNNVFYVERRKERDVRKQMIFVNQGDISGMLIANNIFHVADPHEFQGFEKVRDLVVRNNLYFGKFDPMPDDSTAVTANPFFVAPGKARDSLASATGFKIGKNSPAIGAGVSVPDNGGRDFFGNPVPAGRTDIGAHAPKR